jgi:hypothetical protein
MVRGQPKKASKAKERLTHCAQAGPCCLPIPQKSSPDSPTFAEKMIRMKVVAPNDGLAASSRRSELRKSRKLETNITANHTPVMVPIISRDQRQSIVPQFPSETRLISGRRGRMSKATRRIVEAEIPALKALNLTCTATRFVDMRQLCTAVPGVPTRIKKVVPLGRWKLSRPASSLIKRKGMSFF